MKLVIYTGLTNTCFKGANDLFEVRNDAYVREDDLNPFFLFCIENVITSQGKLPSFRNNDLLFELQCVEAIIINDPFCS